MMKNFFIRAKLFSQMILLALLLVPATALAQDVNVTGVVRDSGNEPLPGATVVIKKPRAATISSLRRR